MQVHDFLSFANDLTGQEDERRYLMILRTVGPDGVEDATKANKIYSAYHLNLSEYPGMFDKLLYNEFVFIYWDTEDEARAFVRENLPERAEDLDDPDYFIQYYLFCNGMFLAGNNSIKGLTELPYQ